MVPFLGTLGKARSVAERVNVTACTSRHLHRPLSIALQAFRPYKVHARDQGPRLLDVFQLQILSQNHAKYYCLAIALESNPAMSKTCIPRKRHLLLKAIYLAI